MQRIVKFGGLSVGGGVLVGLGVVGWLWLHRPEPAAVDSKGGIVSLVDTPTPSPEADGLKVAQAVDGGLGTVLGSNGSGGSGTAGGGRSGSGGGFASGSGSAASGGGTKPAAMPGPDEFEQYEQYHDSQGALFGDIRLGATDEVKIGSVVTVQYRGWLTNGALFDESYSRDQPFTFTEGEHRVISGWEQGLLGMKAGGKRRLIIPPAYGYGAEAHDPIPAGSMLIFDVELVSVTNK